MADSDLWAHLKCGEHLFRTGSILTTYYYNCSWPDFPYVNHSWLFQAVIYAVSAAAGEEGLMALQVLLVLLPFFLLYRILRARTDSALLIAFVLSLGVLAATHRFALRPQHFTFLFLTGFLAILDRYRRGMRRTVWLLPLIMLIWVNMHAESLWGLLVLGTFLVAEWSGSLRPGDEGNGARSRLLLVSGLVLAAALVNPFTWRTALWPLLVMKEQFAGVEEILPPTGPKFYFFWAYFGLVALSVLLNAKRADRFWLALSAVFAVVAWTANRGIPHFVFVSAPLLVGNMEDLAARHRDAFRLPRFAAPAAYTALLAGVLAVSLSVVTSPLYLNKYDNIPYPEGALAFLKTQGIAGNVMNEHVWGGFIIWNSWPGLKPYIDGRFFHRRFYDEYYPLLAGRSGWDRVLDKYGITIAILAYSPGPDPRLNDRLSAHPQWRLAYWDDISLVYLKDTGPRGQGNDMLNVDRDLYAEHAGLPPDALRRLSAAAERNLQAAGGSWKAHVVAANAWFALGEHALARERFMGALRLQRQADPWLYYKIALCYRAEGDLAQAEANAERSFQLVPGSQAAADLVREIRALRGIPVSR